MAQVRKIVDAAYKRTLKLLEEKKDLVTALAEELLEKEVRAPPPKPVRPSWRTRDLPNHPPARPSDCSPTHLALPGENLPDP